MDNIRNSIINEYIKEVFFMLQRAHIPLPQKANTNIYHHCGLENIHETGAMFINVVNREYCKSYVVMLPGQVYPNHYHRIKLESFYVLYQELVVMVDGQEYLLQPGDILNVDRGQDHSFWTKNGAIFEELSTMYVPNDSIYMDDNISKTSYQQRRTTISEEEWKELVKKWNK